MQQRVDVRRSAYALEFVARRAELAVRFLEVGHRGAEPRVEEMGPRPFDVVRRRPRVLIERGVAHARGGQEKERRKQDARHEQTWTLASTVAAAPFRPLRVSVVIALLAVPEQ